MRILLLAVAIALPWSAGGQITPSPVATFLGEDAEDMAGRPAYVGDVNGDGLDDFVIKSSSNAAGGIQSGQVYILFGKLSGWQIDTTLDQADASFVGQEWDEIGSWPTGAGDVNADGYDDFLFAGSATDSGEIYLVLGRNTGWQMGAPLDSVDVSIVGDEENEWLQYTAGGGDVNGDGFDDFLIASHYNSDAAPGAGKVFLFFGRTNGWVTEVGLDWSDASFLGEVALDSAGCKTAAGGDVNGDGFDDALIGATFNSEAGTFNGKAYLVFGGDTGWEPDLFLGHAEASFVGERSYQYIGNPLGIVDDVNGDGFADILLSANGDDENGTNAGQVYLILGRAIGWIPSMDLALADASFLGEGAGDNSGGSVSGAGDMNGDGYGDLLIGAPYNDEAGSDAGKVHVLFGRNSGWSMDMPLSAADGMIWGDSPGDSLSKIAGGGDIDGDGFGDVLANTPYNDEGGQDSGQTYLYLGGFWDADLDGHMVNEGDCDDSDSTVYPGAPELCDGLDNDCDPATDEDEDGDGDGHRLCEDCDDGNPDVHPDAEELCNETDDDCDPLTDEILDSDGDGQSICDGDCDDTDSTVYLDAPELCDGIDNDCDDVVDDDTDVDVDGDGYSACEGDCQPLDDSIHPGAEELCDGIDNDCDGTDPQDELDDLDLDGWTACEGDCDNDDPLVNPGADDDNCDGEDTDCDGVISADESDTDEDGWRPCEGDCDDDDSAIHPEAEELCDGVDNDCNGAVDEGCVEEDDDSAPQLDDDDEPTDCECRITGPAAIEPHGAAFLLLLPVALAIHRRSRIPTRRP